MKTIENIEYDHNEEAIGKLMIGIGEILDSIDKEPSDELSILHENQESISRLSQQENLADLQFLNFFLEKFVNDLWDNIAMTSSKKIQDEYIVDVLQDLAPYFKSIGSQIIDGEYDDCYEEYVGLIDSYFNKVNNVEFQEIRQ